MSFKMSRIGLFSLFLTKTVFALGPTLEPPPRQLTPRLLASDRPPKLFTQVKLDRKGGLHIIKLSHCDFRS